MKKLAIDDIIRNNPHLDRESLDAMRTYLKDLPPRRKTRYRLAPYGTHRVTTTPRDADVDIPRYVRNYPRY